MASSIRLAPLLLLALQPGCADDPVEPVEPRARIDLRAATGRADVRAVGVTVDGSDRRLVLDEEAGLFAIDASGRASLVLALADFPDPGVPIRPPFTDLVALGDQLALTAIGDGFLLDVAAGTMTRHFCYEPGGFPEYQEQRTNALGYDPATGRLYAQPRTFDDSGALLRSELGMYAADSGLDLNWWGLPDQLDAGGLVVLGPDEVVLGEGARLLRYDLVASRLSTLDDLTRYGVTAIDGLALDRPAGLLHVLDGTRDELISIELAQLGL